jgi:23S rRNA (pseudouridine1915-N3)-methyltransferase
MKLTLLAVGVRQPAWADTAYADFAKRFPPEMRLNLKAIKTASRTGEPFEKIMAEEGVRLMGAMPKGAHKVVLDERGTALTTLQLSGRMRHWLQHHQEVVFIIGGPDGLDPALKAQADETWRVSDLTLPHALVRVVAAEALYRAWTLLNNHPYHRA